MSGEVLTPSGTRLRRVVAGVLCAVMLLVGAAPAAADDAAEPGSQGARIAAALAESPLYTDEVFDEVIRPGEREQLLDQIDQTGLPLMVVLTELTEDDPWQGSAANLAQVVYDHLGLDPGDELIMITADHVPSSDSLLAHEWPGTAHQARDAALAVHFNRDLRDASYAIRLRRTIEIIEAGNGSERYAEATERLREENPPPDGAEEETAGSGFPWLTAALVVIPLLAVGSAALLLRARRNRPRVYQAPRSVFATARAISEAELRDRARREVVEFGEELTTLEDGKQIDPARLRNALDAYDAAGSVLDRARSVPDLVGVLALVTEGESELWPKDWPKRLCFFHPLHGASVRRVRWRPLGHTAEVRVPACRECATAVRANRPPKTLTDRHEGRDIPYFEVPAERSLWAATGYGGLGGPSLTERVRRGEFTRAQDARAD